MPDRRVRVDDIEIHYQHGGAEGTPVVLLHGMAETADSCWAGQLAALARQHRCFAPDLRGHGLTTLGDAEQTLDQLGHDLIGFLRAVTGPATVVGFSLGGTIALWAAAQGTGLIQRVIALGASSVISRRTAEFFHSRARTIHDRDFLSLHHEMSGEIRAMFHAHPSKAEAYAARRIAAIGEGQGYANAALAMADMRHHPLQPHLAAVDCPVDVVAGEHDAWCPQKASDIILDGLPDHLARYHRIPSVGHLMSVDDPEAVSSLLLRLLSTSPVTLG